MTTGPSEEFVETQLRLSQEFLDDSTALLQQRRFRSSVDRAYYAIHYSAIALLCHYGVRPPRSHSGLVNVFGLEIVKAGVIEAEFGRMLNDALHGRSQSTYSADATITLDDAQSAVADAERFVSKIRTILSEQPRSQS